MLEPLVGLMPGIPELLIILAVVLLLFGGSRLAGLGKSTGRAIKEFKDETKGLKGDKANPNEPPAVAGPVDVTPTAPPVESYPPAQPPHTDVTNPVDGDRR